MWVQLLLLYQLCTAYIIFYSLFRLLLYYCYQITFMYPNLYYVFKDLFDVEWGFLRFANTFGLFVGLGFIAAALVITAELKRKEAIGVLKPKEELITLGKPASLLSLSLNFILGFLLGFKLLEMLIAPDKIPENTQEYIFSAQGNWWAGLILGAVLFFLKWKEKNLLRLKEPEQRKLRIWPHDRVPRMIILAAVWGFIGAKIFHILEHFQEFLLAPASMLLSPGGLTYFGGLLFATLAIWWYAKRWKIDIWHLNDAAAPALMLSYAIGRIGCQVSGDGDWGIVNTSPTKVSWLPDWFWSYTYPNNIAGAGRPIPGCSGPYCYELAQGVYPTPFYETIICLILFGVLMYCRKRLKAPGALFSIYLIFAGTERFFIEKIRVNEQFEFLGIVTTQASFIAVLLIITGVLLFIWRKKQVFTN